MLSSTHANLKRIRIVILASLLVLSAFNQWNYNLASLSTEAKEVFDSFSLTDYQRHYRMLGPVFDCVAKINTLPDDAVLYFVPVFPDTRDAQHNIFWWWHLNHILRYFCYPKKILALHFDLYNNDKTEYMRKFMQKKRFSDLDWVRSRNITHLILYRDNAISIVPVSQEIFDL